MTASTITRRAFCAAGMSGMLGAGSLAASLRASDEPSRLHARPAAPKEKAKPGTHPLELGASRDGFLYVPPSYDARTPAPLLVLLHGATQSSALWTRVPLDAVFGERGIVVLAPDSRDRTWDLSLGGYGPDVEFIDRAMRFTYQRCNVDARRVALGGFSDGGSYALSLGITNGDLFAALLAFSPGYLSPAARRGRPPIFMEHGTADRILPIDETSRTIVPRLRGEGYDVTYREFDGPHTVTPQEMHDATAWMLAKTASR